MLVAAFAVLGVLIFGAMFAISSFEQIESIDVRLNTIERLREQDKERENFEFLTSLSER